MANFHNEDGISVQDRLMASMSQAQIRLYRKQATEQATQGRYASEHNQYSANIVEDIHKGERLTNKTLKKLIEQTKRSLDAGDILDFTLGNTARNRRLSQQAGLINSLTPATLGLFIANVQTAAKQFAGGISPRQVVNQSRFVDIKRANEQIHLATIFKRQGNKLYFLTNSGPESKSINHKVVVELLDYPAMMVGRKKLPTQSELKNMLENGKIKFDCDCGRHQYWYRYIASVGKFNFGAYENRYPSTRNPNLTGVGCKHVLRVMQQLMSNYGQLKVKGYIKADLAKGDGKGLSQRANNEQVKRESQYQTDPRKAEHYRRKIEKKVKEQLKIAFKAISEPTELQAYNRIKALQRVDPSMLSEKALATIRNFESGNAPLRNR